jgi:hypothetical protein
MMVYLYLSAGLEDFWSAGLSFSITGGLEMI